MEGWQDDWSKALETVANEFEQFFQNVGREISEFTDNLIEFSEEIADEMEQAIIPKLDQIDYQMTEWLDPLLQAILGVEATIDRAVEPVTHTVEPWLNQHPVCIGCRHYHGQMYSGNLLICAMHPYGVDEGAETCSDKELVSWSFPSANQHDSFDQN